MDQLIQFLIFPTVVSPAGSSAVTITGINFSSIRDLESASIAVITTVEKVIYYDNSTMISNAPPMGDITKVLLEFAADGINFFDFGAHLLYTPSIILKDISPRAGLFDDCHTLCARAAVGPVLTSGSAMECARVL